MILAFIRHGETQANAQRRYLGKTDESLSERGKQLLLLSCQKQHVCSSACVCHNMPHILWKPSLHRLTNASRLGELLWRC